MSTGVRRADFSPEVEPIEFGLSTARPTNPRAGRLRYETDTSTYVYYDGSNWQTAHFTAENVQDTAGAMWTGNTETGITVTYQDSDGTMDAALDLNSLTTDTPVTGDYIPFVDVSESNAGNKMLVTELMKLLMPVETVIMRYDSTNPNTVYGFGTWSQIAQGEALVGFKSADTPFGTLGSIGASGTKTHTLSIGELPAHSHTGPSHSHDLSGTWVKTTIGSGGRADGGAGTRNTESGSQATANAGTGDTGNTGSSQAHNNIQPSYVVYVWRRTA